MLDSASLELTDVRFHDNTRRPLVIAPLDHEEEEGSRRRLQVRHQVSLGWLARRLGRLMNVLHSVIVLCSRAWGGH